MTKRFRVTVNAVVNHTYEIDLDEADLPDTDIDDHVTEAFYNMDHPQPIETESIAWEVTNITAVLP